MSDDICHDLTHAQNTIHQKHKKTHISNSNWQEIGIHTSKETSHMFPDYFSFYLCATFILGTVIL